MVRLFSKSSVALAIIVMLSGCASLAPQAASTPSPTKTPLVFDHDPLQCMEPSGASGESVGFCTTMTAEGLRDKGYKVGDIRGPWFSFDWVCQKAGPSSLTFKGGPLLLTHFTNPEADFMWDPKAYSTISISIDQGEKQEISYSTRNMYGVSHPESISLLDNNPNFMRDLAGATTLQVWARDADGVNHEMVFNVENNVARVAELAAKGYACRF